MTRLLAMALLSTGVLVMSACGEKPQEAGASKTDASPYVGTGSNFASPGWKQGDKVSWEQHLRARTQNTQNEYNRTK
jgi:hypothetical protein